MTVFYVNPSLRHRELLHALYAGDLVMRTGLGAVRRLADLAREQLTELFHPHPLLEVHEHLGTDEVARRLARWKPSFMHGARSKALVREIIVEAGFPESTTYYDLPTPRTAFPTGHLTTGVAYAFPWHRDTWYGAPAQQVNWWLPVSEIHPDNALHFDLDSFAAPVANTSSGWDYDRSNPDRKATPERIGLETQARPTACDHTCGNGLVVAPEVGSLLLFSGSHLHATVPNVSGRARYSIDFRTVERDDVEARRGAPQTDVMCNGNAIRDYVRVSDDSPFPVHLDDRQDSVERDARVPTAHDGTR